MRVPTWEHLGEVFGEHLVKLSFLPSSQPGVPFSHSAYLGCETELPFHWACHLSYHTCGRCDNSDFAVSLSGSLGVLNTGLCI